MPTQTLLRAPSSPVQSLQPPLQRNCRFLRWFWYKALSGLVSSRAIALRAPIAGETAASECAPRYEANTICFAKREHLPFLFTIQQILHGEEPCPSIRLRDSQLSRELPRIHRRRTM